MLIDCHTHAFADKIAAKAVEQLITYYKMPTEFGGRLADLMTVADQAGLDALVLLVAATRPEQVKPANDWALSMLRMTPDQLRQDFFPCSTRALTKVPQLIPFGTFHPNDPNWLEEISRLRAAGIKGIKLHPEFQGIDLADPRLDSFFEEVAPDFILMIHMGDPLVSEANFSTPRKLRHILEQFPKLRAIAAHLGGYCFWEQSYQELAGREVYFDTSSALAYIDPGMLRRLVSKHGTERILFGSDYPLRAPWQDLELLEQIPWLTAKEKEAISWRNCARLLDIQL
ncbi:MAG TPA: amidohydrolase family protein [Bacillota bacterium]